MLDNYNVPHASHTVLIQSLGSPERKTLHSSLKDDWDPADRLNHLPRAIQPGQGRAGTKSQSLSLEPLPTVLCWPAHRLSSLNWNKTTISEVTSYSRGQKSSSVKAWTANSSGSVGHAVFAAATQLCQDSVKQQ